MGTIDIAAALQRSPVVKIISLLLLLYFISLLLINVDDAATQIVSNTKTVAGHNLAPTPWHPFEPKVFDSNTSRYSQALHHIKCTYLSCHSGILTPSRKQTHYHPNTSAVCPSFFRWIHRDLEPWARSGITNSVLETARRWAAFRVVIVDGRLYVEHYYACGQPRAMFTIWGLLQLLTRYPGMVPDVDMMFDCMDKPQISKGRRRWPGRLPPPLFRYCTNIGHWDIPFPDWSFWGWPETNIQPWDEEFRSIKQGSEAMIWMNKSDHAYWKGNPFVQSRARTKLLRCNDTRKFGAEVLIQDWMQESKVGFKQSKLSDQCKHRYKIYAEGYAWSVSLKYIVSCGSPTLIISPVYEDFFSRGLVPKQNYWPISSSNLCTSIKSAVEWGNANPSQAEAIGKAGQDLMRELNMERVYDYMYHLINEYSKLQRFKPRVPSTARVVCEENLLCYADPRSREFLRKSTVSPLSSPPCTLQTADPNIIKSWIANKLKVISDIEEIDKSFGRRNKT